MNGLYLYLARNDNGGVGDACGCCYPRPDCRQCSHSEALLDSQRLRQLPRERQRGRNHQEPRARPGLPVTLCKCHLCQDSSSGVLKVGLRFGLKITSVALTWSCGVCVCSQWFPFLNTSKVKGSRCQIKRRIIQNWVHIYRMSTNSDIQNGSNPQN